MHPTLCCIEGARITGKRSAQRARDVMAQVECDAQSHGCGPDAGTIDGTLVLLDLGMKKGFRTPPKTLTVEPGIPGVCCYFAVFSVYHDIGCLATHPALVGPLSRLSFVRIPLFSEKITMGARSGQSEHQHVLLYEIDQQQVWCDMALPHAPRVPMARCRCTRGRNSNPSRPSNTRPSNVLNLVSSRTVSFTFFTQRMKPHGPYTPKSEEPGKSTIQGRIK